MKEGLLVHRLEGGGEVLVVGRDLGAGRAWRAEQLAHRVGEDAADRGRAAVPDHGHALGVVAKAVEVETIAAAGQELDDPAHGGHLGRLAVGGEAHDLVLIAIVGKAQELRHRLVEEAERVGKEDAAADVDPGAAAGAPHGAGEVAEAVDREHGRALEGGDVEGAGEVGEMVLDVVEARLEPGGVGAESGGEQARRAPDPGRVPQARPDQMQARSVDDAEHGLFE